jgi:radical SAM superfamily enzyme YgiQ (UPF0313 family)
MRVLLAHPPLNTGREVTPPLGLCTLAAWLRHENHEVRILDLDLEVKGLPDASQMYRKLLVQGVRDFSPQAVGITSMYNNSLQAERMAQTVKECDSAIVTIGGGSHFGALGRRALERIPELDYTIEGEGEQAFAGLLAAIESGGSAEQVPRVCSRGTKIPHLSAAPGLVDLADLPPIWSTLDRVIDLRRYAATIPESAPRRAIYIEAGRGCPFACSFCATAPFWERKYRVKPVERIIDEMRFLLEQYDYNAFMLVHDLLTVDKNFVSRFSDALMASRLPVEWMANHRTDINLYGLLPKMKTAGCWAMFFGIESASTRLQKVMHKGLKREEVISTITSLSDLGIASTCSFVIGFPDESQEELSATIAMAAELKLIGAGMIQLHRLRTWPPAPLAQAKLPAEFDVDSLRIEYPFTDVPVEDISDIKSDPEFFAGYFAPYSKAGRFEQLAHVELFFTQAIAAAPLTTAVLGQFLGKRLVETFYDVLSVRRAITRNDIEMDSSSLLPVWLLLQPFFQEWAAGRGALQEWQREIVKGVMSYEDYRIRFINSDEPIATRMQFSGNNWGAFVSDVDIAGVFDAMIKGQPLSPELLQKCAIVLVCQELNSYRAYTLDVSRIGELQGHPLLAGPGTESR